MWWTLARMNMCFTVEPLLTKEENYKNMSSRQAHKLLKKCPWNVHFFCNKISFHLQMIKISLGYTALTI